MLTQYNLIYKTKKVNNKQIIFDEVSLLQKLINFESITPKSSDCIKQISNWLEDIGFYTEIVQTFNDDKSIVIDNLFATRYGEKPSIGFCGHADVVPAGEGWTVPPFSSCILGGEIYGRGALDMKGEIAAFIAAVSKSNTKNEIVFLGSGAEEKFSQYGMEIFSKYLENEKKLTLDYCLTGEPTSLNQLGDVFKLGRRGNIDFNINFFENNENILKTAQNLTNPIKGSDIVPVGLSFGVSDAQYLMEIIGRQGHSAYKERYINPIDVLIDNYAKIKKDIQILGVNSGFIACNIVPDKTLVYFNSDNQNFLNKINKNPQVKININKNTDKSLIFNPQIDINIRFDASLNSKKLIDEMIKRSDEKAKVQILGINDSYEFIEGDFVQKLKKAVKKITGIVPKDWRGGGTSDTRYLTKIAKQALDFGLVGAADKGGMHKADERVLIQDLIKLTDIYIMLLK